MQSTKLHFASALTPEGWREDVTVAVERRRHDHGRHAGAGEGAMRISGIAVPAMPNVHSHAHQRFMLGLAERAGPGADSFWTWREAMYGFALRLSPDDLEAVAAQLYVEMLKAGFSVVGEFQYLHHQPDGTPYADPAEMSLRCLAAAEAGGDRHHHAADALCLWRLRRAAAGAGPAPLHQWRGAVSSRSSSSLSIQARDIRCAASASRRIRCAR